MAKPQPEDGTVRIARELYTAIVMAPFSKRELKIVLAWIRVGYGWRKKETGLSKTFLAQYTKIPLPHIGVTLTALLDKDVFQEKEGKIRLNKNYEEWDFGEARLPKREVLELDALSKNGAKLPKREAKVTKPVSGGYQNSNPRLPKWEVTKLRKPMEQGIPAPYAIYNYLQKGKKFPSYCDIQQYRAKHRITDMDITSIVESALYFHVTEEDLTTFLKDKMHVKDISELPKSKVREVCSFIALGKEKKGMPKEGE